MGMSKSELRIPTVESTPQPAATPPLSLRLHIERLVIDGLPFAGRDAALFQSSLETELTRLLRDGRFSADGVHSVALASLPAAQCALGEAADARASGRRVAGTLYETLHGRAFTGGLEPATARPTLENHHPLT